MKRSSARTPSHKTPPPQRSAVEHLPALGVTALTAMTVVAHLVPFDTSAEQWNNVAAIMLWLLLGLGWALAGVLRGRAVWVIDRTTVLVLALTLLPGLSALALTVTTSGNARLAMNLAWQWASFGLLFFLARQWLRQAADVRMLAAVMLAIVAGLTAFSFAQFAYLMPQARAEYKADPEGVLLRAGIDAPLGSPLRRHFQDRLESTEPTATFALTNSFAGLLTPWLVLAAGLAARHLSSWSELRRFGWRPAVLALWFGLALVLTKSRTAYLATLAGIGLALLYATQWGRKLDVRLLLGGGLVTAALALVGVVSGALDVEVLSEAPKSVLYRFQYWQATARLIREHPLWGVGPGNFQDTYKWRQLPEASENVADPHNFVLEIWATSGTPALVVLAALAIVFPWEVRRAVRRLPEADSPCAPTAPWSAHVAAGAVGIALAGLCALLSDMLLDNASLAALALTGLPAAAITFWCLRPWIERGTMTLTLLIAPLVALLINLIAAGGISFPGVSSSVWLLMVMALVVSRVGHSTEVGRGVVRPSSDDAHGEHAPDQESVETPFPAARTLSRAGAIAWLLVMVAANLGYHLSVYRPVFYSLAALGESELAARTGRLSAAIEHAREAAAADPLSPQPWRRLAALWDARMQVEGDTPALRTEFDRACDEWLVRNPRAHTAYNQVAEWRLLHYRRWGNPSDLAAARHDLEQAVARYPHNALAHAQLAWTAHLAGDADAAARWAASALELDGRHHHEEYKLENLRLFDPGNALQPEQTPSPGEESAEPIMRQLRKASLSP